MFFFFPSYYDIKTKTVGENSSYSDNGQGGQPLNLTVTKMASRYQLLSVVSYVKTIISYTTFFSIVLFYTKKIAVN